MYIDPNTVVSPKGSWKLKRVLYNSAQVSQQGGWSVAEGEWDGNPCVGVRWNGSANEDGVGNPQSRGHATWFIVPEGLEDAVLREVGFLKQKEDIVSCKIYQPDDYDFGAWRVVATLGQRVLERLGGTLVFNLPSLSNRICHPDKSYVCAIDGERRGIFKEGQWQGDVYSNGVSETENPTTIEEVRDIFIENVMRAVQQREGA